MTETKWKVKDLIKCLSDFNPNAIIDDYLDIAWSGPDGDSIGERDIEQEKADTDFIVLRAYETEKEHELKTTNSLTAQLSELEEELMNIEQKALEMIQHYTQEYENSDGLILCDQNQNTAATLIEFLRVIGKDDLVKHFLRTGEIEVNEED